MPLEDFPESTSPKMVDLAIRTIHRKLGIPAEQVLMLKVMEKN